MVDFINYKEVALDGGPTPKRAKQQDNECTVTSAHQQDNACTVTSAQQQDNMCTVTSAKQQDNLRTVTSDVCNEHTELKLDMFCDETSCQEILCVSCVVLKHIGHRVKKLSEKNAEVRKEMENIQNSSTKAIENLTTHYEKLQYIKTTINISSQSTLKKIKEEKKKIFATKEKEVKEHTKKVQAIRQNELKKVEETMQDIEAKTAEFEKIRQLSAKVILEDNIHKVNAQHIRELYHHNLSAASDTKKIIKGYQTLNFEIAATNGLQNQVMGNVFTEKNMVDFLFTDVDEPSNASPSREDTQGNTEGNDTATNTQAASSPQAGASTNGHIRKDTELQSTGENPPVASLSSSEASTYKHMESHRQGKNTGIKPKSSTRLQYTCTMTGPQTLSLRSAGLMTSWKSVNEEHIQSDREGQNSETDQKSPSLPGTSGESNNTKIMVNDTEEESSPIVVASWSLSQPQASVDGERLQSDKDEQNTGTIPQSATVPTSGPSTSGECMQNNMEGQGDSLLPSQASADREHMQSDTQGEYIGINSQANSLPSVGITKQVSVTKLTSWQCDVRHLSSSASGNVYTASKDTIEAFDLKGNLKMGRKVTENTRIRRMACYRHNQRDTLVLVLGNNILELRDGLTGDLLDRQRTQNFTLHPGICQDSPRTILISGKTEGQCKVMQCIIDNNSRITRVSNKYVINLEKISGVTFVKSNNRKIIVATCGYLTCERSIVAVNYESKDELWKITEPMLKLNGMGISPWTICTDGRGHLFVTDTVNNRVVVMDTQGKIQQEVCKQLAGSCFDTTRVPFWNKLIVADHKHNNRYINVYDIKYQS